MPSFAEVLAALPAFRNDLMQGRDASPLTLSSFHTRGAYSAMASPLSNIHATGVGIALEGGEYKTDEFVLKVYVFDKVEPELLGDAALTEWNGYPVDVEALPIQRVRARTRRAQSARAGGAIPAVEPTIGPERLRQRPVVAGVSISPLHADYVGTLGCFLRRQRPDGEEILALSNNHVLADVDRLPIGTPIVQPGPEQPPFTTRDTDVFATLRLAIPLRFPTGINDPAVNRFDAALASVTDLSLIQPGVMFGGIKYAPSSVKPPVPGTRVVKVGRTTGVTRGLITAIEADGVQINYGATHAPRIAVFDGVMTIAAVDTRGPFSLPGDSGALVLEEQTGSPVGLLFAGDGVHSTACDLGRLCRRLRAWPI